MMTLLGSSLGLCRLLPSFVSHPPPFTHSFLLLSLPPSLSLCYTSYPVNTNIQLQGTVDLKYCFALLQQYLILQTNVFKYACECVSPCLESFSIGGGGSLF